MTSLDSLATVLESAEISLNESSIADSTSIGSLLDQVERELQLLEPALESLNKLQQLLQDTRLKKQRLVSLRLSLQSLLSTQQSTPLPHYLDGNTLGMMAHRGSHATENPNRFSTFYPDKAFEAAKTLLPRRDSINYELFRGLVFAGGQATTQQLLDYLVEHQIRMPSSGETFEEVGLTQISSRINYLIRKGLAESVGRGQFRLTVGWESSLSDAVSV